MRLVWDVDPVLFDGPTPLRIYGLCLSIALIGGFLLWRWQLSRAGYSEQVATYGFAYGLAAVTVGARLGHCLIYEPARYLAAPWEILMVWRGGLASHGAFLGLLIVIPIYARQHRVPLVEILDRLSFATAWAAAWVRLGNLFNSEIVGRPTDGTWGFRFPRFDRVPLEEVPLRHPSQLYEVLLGLLVLFVLLGVDRAQKEQRARGLLGALFLSLYFAGRLVVEEFKAYQTLPTSFPLTMGQLLSIAPLIWGLTWLSLLWVKAQGRR